MSGGWLVRQWLRTLAESACLNMQDIGLYFALVLILLPAGIVVTRALTARRRRVWQRFARRHGLQHDAREGALRFHGRIGGRDFELSTLREELTGGEMGVQQYELKLQLRSGIPPGLSVRKLEGVLGQVARAVEETSEATGDADFDQWFVVEAADENEQPGHGLCAGHRESLRHLATASGSAEVGIEQGALFWRDREVISRVTELEGCLNELLQAAEAFDAATQQARGTAAAPQSNAAPGSSSSS